MINTEDEKRFWSHVQKLDNCWVWVGGKTGGGCGYFSLRGKTNRDHRVSWVIENGLIPPGLCVLHKCDNPPCVRPSHLMLGTLLDNTRDMMTKGRSKFHISKGKSHPGESHPQTSLTWKAVRIIRAKYASGKHTQKEIGKMYGLCPAAISAITLNKTWKE